MTAFSRRHVPGIVPSAALLLVFLAWCSGVRAAVTDIDRNGSVDALTDGILVVRYIFGFRGDTLVDGAVDPNGERILPQDIEEYLAMLTAPQQLNDTGILTCSDAGTNGLPCPLAGYPGQDAQYGRDATQNDDSDGHAGFRFTKLDAAGNPLPANAAYWSCVRDEVTGRTWELKTDYGGLHYKDDIYTWYNPDPTRNGGFEGYPDGSGAVCYGYDAGDPATYCNTQAYVARVNAAGWCGHQDWRIPTRVELEGLVSLDRFEPAIDDSWFPRTQSGHFWSASPYANSTNLAWGVDFGYGHSNDYFKYNVNYFRLVRGGQ
jgi:hypothetical protein